MKGGFFSWNKRNSQIISVLLLSLFSALLNRIINGLCLASRNYRVANGHRHENQNLARVPEPLVFQFVNSDRETTIPENPLNGKDDAYEI